MIAIGPYTLDSPVVLAPMAGVTDQPFRTLCRRFGAGLAASEMLSANPALWNSEKSRLRRRHDGEREPRAVQIAGFDPAQMAEAARCNVAEGAQIIDINMGCPAKKVCKRAAGSALLRDEALVQAILRAVVGAVDVPVTLKIRTGWCPDSRNGVNIARIAEHCGVSALAVHGRTRACLFRGMAEYDTIAAIKTAIGIPVFANGDIDSPQRAAFVLDYTGADGVMIGRAAQGQPWIFQQTRHYLQHGELPPAPTRRERLEVVLAHVADLHRFYGDFKGVLIARKHLAWYLRSEADGAAFRQRFNRLEGPQEQLESIQALYADAAIQGELAA